MILAAVLGLMVGLILALTGAGGAIIAVPMLMFGLNWEVNHAAPVALLAVGSSAAVGALIGLRQSLVRYRAAGLMALLGSVMTPLGVMAAHRIPAAPLALVFSVVLAYVARRMFRLASASLRGESLPTPRSVDAPCKLSETTGRLVWNAPCTQALAKTGLITGFLSGMLGVGGGFVIVPALQRTTDLPMNAIVATSLTVIALVSISAVSSAALAGHLDMAVALPFATGAIVGMLGGRSLAGRLPDARLQQGFAVVAGCVAAGLIVRVMLAA